jgi:hypothetical protein
MKTQSGGNLMATVKQVASKRLKMAERAQQQMNVHFPDVDPMWVWNRKKNHGYTTVPRTLPLVMQAIDMESKGQPAGHTLFCLWARSPDHPVLTIENPATFASEAGFSGPRAVDTWRRRMKKLAELWFIMPKAGPSGDFHHVLLTNPNAMMEWMRLSGLVQDGLYSQFLDRTAEIGAFVEVEATRHEWARVEAAKKLAAEQLAAGQAASPGQVVPPPPPPPPATLPEESQL